MSVVNLPLAATRPRFLSSSDGEAKQQLAWRSYCVHSNAVLLGGALANKRAVVSGDEVKP